LTSSQPLIDLFIPPHTHTSISHKRRGRGVDRLPAPPGPPCTCLSHRETCPVRGHALDNKPYRAKANLPRHGRLRARRKVLVEDPVRLGVGVGRRLAEPEQLCARFCVIDLRGQSAWCLPAGRSGPPLALVFLRERGLVLSWRWTFVWFWPPCLCLCQIRDQKSATSGTRGTRRRRHSTLAE